MIDWLTLNIDIGLLSPEDRDTISTSSSRLQKISPDGEIIWDTSTFESLRSDCTGLAWSAGTKLTLAGSPASVVHSNNVFGTDSVYWAFTYMLDFFDRFMGTNLPRDMKAWGCSRMDITQNYDMGGQAAVKQALYYLRNCPTRGNNVERRHTTVYWNKSSTLRSGKAYNKYEHAKALTKKNQANYTKDQLMKTRNLLRLELKLGRHWFQRHKHWSTLTVEELKNQHALFFGDITKTIEVPTMDTLLDRLNHTAPTSGQAIAAYNYYLQIREQGLEMAREYVTKSSHYRHIKNLKNAGLTNADLTTGNILQFRPQVITMQPVNTWSDIAA